MSGCAPRNNRFAETANGGADDAVRDSVVGSVPVPAYSQVGTPPGWSGTVSSQLLNASSSGAHRPVLATASR